VLQSFVSPTVARLTLRGLLGRRRGLLLLAVPALLLVLSVIIRVSVGQDESTTVNVLGTLALGTLVPLLGLIAGTGAIGPEIDDGSIIYLLAKPLPRWKIITTKLAVAIGCTVVFAAIPTYLAGVILFGDFENLALGYGVAALIAGIAYSSIFLLFGVITRHAVVIGLIYSLLWESILGNFVTGVKDLSVQQWALAVAAKIADPGVVSSAVHLPTAVPLLIVVALGAAAYAAFRLTRLTLAGEE
jgi:ABC-2 type transport system permease protein